MEDAMDPEEARLLVAHGASLLLLEMPPASHFGIDLDMFTIGSKFKGVKMIPPGPHFVYYSSGSRHGNDYTPVTGFFVYVTTSKVFVRKWDPLEERLVQLFDTDEEDRLISAVKHFHFDKELAAYNVQHLKTWQHLSSYISQTVIEKLEPVGGDISVTAEGAVLEKNFQTMAERELMEKMSKFNVSNSERLATSNIDLQRRENSSAGEEALKSKNRIRGSGRCFYTPLLTRVHQPGMSAAEITSLNMDKSTMLESVLQKSFNGSEDALLGEFQFSFIAFLMGQSLESFGQWKAFITLMFSCEEAPLQTRTKLFIKFLRALYFQLKQSLSREQSENEQYEQPPQPIFDKSLFCEDNFLWLLCKEFFVMLRTSQPIDGDLISQVRRLEKLLQSCLGWSFEDLSNIEVENEYAPVVVYQ